MLKKPASSRSQLIDKAILLNVAQRLRLRCFDSPAALLDGLFEHPARCVPVVLDVQVIESQPCTYEFSFRRAGLFTILFFCDCGHHPLGGGEDFRNLDGSR